VFRKNGATFLIGFIGASASLAHAEALRDQIALKLATHYPQAKIEIEDNLSCQTLAPSGETEVRSIAVEVTDRNGQVRVWLNGSRECVAQFSAWIPARVAVRRVHPGEVITSEAFVTQSVDISKGTLHEVRGLIVAPTEKLEKLIARQSVLEGSPLLRTGVERAPDVRKGEAISIKLLSGGVTLSTTGVSEEPGYLGGVIHVMSQKTKHSLVGTLTADHSVEVRL
jgi:flagella basal body P-ring formation protein FlgA